MNDFEKKKQTEVIYISSSTEDDDVNCISVTSNLNSQKKKAFKLLHKKTKEKKKEVIPELKILTFSVSEYPKINYQIAVDAFCYSANENITFYFLTHFHSDHYTRLNKKWLKEKFEINPNHKIFCTELTKKFLILCLNLDPDKIEACLLNKRCLIKSYDKFYDSKNFDINQNKMLSKTGLYVTSIDANHCPGAAIFLFESVRLHGSIEFFLHCGDFRVISKLINHPSLASFNIECSPNPSTFDKIYLDTTYLSPLYNFPPQKDVLKNISEMLDLLSKNLLDKRLNVFEKTTQSKITDFFFKKKKKILIVVGSYFIGKEKIVLEIMDKINCPVYILDNKKQTKVKAVKFSFGSDLKNHLINNPLGDSSSHCVIHLVTMNIVKNQASLINYFKINKYFQYFEKCIGLKPTGWTFKKEQSDLTKKKFTIFEDYNQKINDNETIKSLIFALKQKTSFFYKNDIISQHPAKKFLRSEKNTDLSICKLYTLPYSEHSSFRELGFFSIFINSNEIISNIHTDCELKKKETDYFINLFNLIRLIKTDKLPPNQLAYLSLNLNNLIKSLTMNDF